MRVTILNQFYKPDLSPTAHLSGALAEDRACRGDAVTVVTSRGGYVAASKLADSSEANPRVIRIWTPLLGKQNLTKRLLDYASFYLLSAWTLSRLPAQDVIVSLTTPPFIACAAWLHRLLHPRTRIVLWNMDCYPEAAERSGVVAPTSVVSRVLRWLNRRIFASLDHLVTLDHAMEELLLSRYRPRGRDLTSTVIPNFESAAQFPKSVPTPRWGEAQGLGLDGKFVVLYLGNAGISHEFGTVLEVARELAAEPVVFLFVGGGSRWRDLEMAREKHGLANLILHDYVQKEATGSVMAASDCALITLSDAMLGVVSPSKLHSNLAAGLPILYVGPARSNVDEALLRFGCGFSLRHGDTVGLGAAIRGMMGRDAAYQALRARARTAFDEAYCDTRAMSRFDHVLRQAVSGVA